mgnify:CR=1 FL=1
MTVNSNQKKQLMLEGVWDAISKIMMSFQLRKVFKKMEEFSKTDEPKSNDIQNFKDACLSISYS